MTSSLCQFGGSFHLLSGRSAVRLVGEKADFFECSYDGVAIRLELDTSRIRALNESLEEIRKRGEKMATELGTGDTELTASKMSRMLSK